MLDETAPGSRLPDGTALKGGFNLGDALRNDLAGTEGVVADFGIAHLTGHNADGFTGSRQGEVGIMREGVVQKLSVSLADGVAAARGAEANAVHDR